MSKLPADFCFASAVAITRAIRDGSVSCAESMEAHLARIDVVNPKLNAIVTLDGERALEEARRLDAHLARGELAGPLHGFTPYY